MTSARGAQDNARKKRMLGLTFPSEATFSSAD
ncbi:hypothetical protein ABIE13_001483 [Ottowia thiooxydans]|uniref:Uncharacterized protein n=1 Tax=Ottowia thiooxydans TaxID=219182 RepID=A0ABV2Q5R8_9BURK